MNFESIDTQYDIKRPNNTILKSSILKYRSGSPKSRMSKHTLYIYFQPHRLYNFGSAQLVALILKKEVVRCVTTGLESI